MLKLQQMNGLKEDGKVGRQTMNLLYSDEIKPNMLEHGEKIIGGVRFIMKALQLDHAYIGIEDNKMNAVNHLKEAGISDHGAGRHLWGRHHRGSAPVPVQK